MENVEETCFLEIKQVFSSSVVNDEKKLVLTLEEVNTLRSLLDQLNELQQLFQHVLAPLLQRHKVNVHIVTLLQFPELIRSFINRAADAGILEDDLQRFRMFHAAMRLVTKSADERGQDLSDKVESLITDMTSMMWRVLRNNDILPPEPPRSGHLEERLDKTTKEFLDIVGERNKENVLTAEMTIEEDFTDNENADLRAIYDVRNYVIVRDLGYMLLNFQEDLGHLIG